MNPLTFACMIEPGRAARESVRLAASVRAFGGHHADSPVLALLPGGAGALPEDALRQLRALDARLIPFPIQPDALQFPFAAKAYAAAAAEGETGTPLVVWMDSGSLVLQPPNALVLPEDKALGYRPVDHQLIGSSYDAPLDPFWTLIYERCGVSKERVFPMLASADRARIRPYFNAGMLVARPERGLLRAWRDRFDALYRDLVFEAFYKQSARYRIFIHQAVLAGTILAAIEPQALQELHHWVNYPLHMHAQYSPEHRAPAVNDLVTCRYEELFEDAAWRQEIAVREPLTSWIEAQTTD